MGLFKRLLAVLLAAGMLVSLAAAAGCAGGKETAPKPQEKVKIGGIFDITGGTGDVGTPYSEGARACVEFLNSKGGINGRQIELIWQDYAYDIKRAKEIYDKLVQQDKVVAILGWGTGDTEALKSIIARDKIPYISGSYSEGLLDINQCPYNFLIAASYSDQARAALKWIKDNWRENRKPRVAFVYNNTPFGTSPIADAKKFAQENGFEVVADEVMELKVLDATTQMLDLKQKKADFAIIQGTSNLAATTLKDAKKVGVTTRFIGLNWAADEKVIQLAGEAAEGYIGVIPFCFPGEDVPAMADIEAWLTRNNKSLKDINQKFVQGWMAVLVLAEGIKNAGDNLTGEGVRQGLEQLNNFSPGGLGAPLTFTATSHRGTEQVRLAEVKNGKFVYVTDWFSYKQ